MEACRSSLPIDNTKSIIQIKWVPPDSNCWKVNVDASVRQSNSTDGLASIGIVMRDTTCSWLNGALGCIGLATPLQAELSAIYHGLLFAWELHPPKVCLETDCLEAVAAIQQADEDHNYYELIKAIRDLLDKLWSVSINHIWREANQVADRLASIGMTHKEAVKVLNEPPVEIKMLLDQDKRGQKSWSRCIDTSI